MYEEAAMAQAGSQQLNKRLTRIEARRRALRRGVIYSVNHDGLIIARPRRRGLRRPIHLVFVWRDEAAPCVLFISDFCANIQIFLRAILFLR